MSYLETTHIDKVINNYCSRICHRIKCYTINNVLLPRLPCKQNATSDPATKEEGQKDKIFMEKL